MVLFPLKDGWAAGSKGNLGLFYPAPAQAALIFVKYGQAARRSAPSENNLPSFSAM
jgi:hypothetical protein